MVRPSKSPDLKAEITFLTTGNGGRSNPVCSGYRPNHDFGIEGMLNDAHHEYAEVEWVHPGDTARAELWLLAPEYQAGRLFPGFKFTVQEGPRVVAHGVVTEVVNASLRHDT